MKKKRLHTQKRLALRRAVCLTAVLALFFLLSPYTFRNEAILRYEEQRQGLHQTQLVVSYHDPEGRPGTRLLLSQNKDCILFSCAFLRFFGWEPFFSVPFEREAVLPLQWSTGGWGTGYPFDKERTESYQYVFGRLSQPEVTALRFQHPKTKEVLAETSIFYTAGQERYFICSIPLSHGAPHVSELLAFGVDALGNEVCEAEISR